MFVFNEIFLVRDAYAAGTSPMVSETCPCPCTTGMWILQSGAHTSISIRGQEGLPVYLCTRNGTKALFQSSCSLFLTHLLRFLMSGLRRFAGWWGHEMDTRFQMPGTFSPIRGAQGFQQSNPSILATASLLGSLQVFKDAGMMPALRKRSLMLTADLESRLQQSKYFVPSHEVAATYPPCEKLGFTIITPTDRQSRGAQLSLLILPPGSGAMRKLFAEVASYGVIGDRREPDVIRLSPMPLYNSMKDCEQAAVYFEKALESLAGV
jgi:kynureninase